MTSLRYDLDRTDRHILRLLQVEGRISNVELSRRIGLTPPPTLERVRRLEREGAIQGYSARIDPAAAGLHLTVFASVSLAMHQGEVVEEFEAAVADLPDILECHHVTGKADFLLKVRVADTPGYERLLRERLLRLPGVQRIESSVVLSTKKEDHVLPLPDASA